MLISSTKLIGTPVLSMQTVSPIATVSAIVIDPDTLKIVALRLGGYMVGRSSTNLLLTDSIREYSHLGIIIDDLDELIADNDVLKLQKVLELNFELLNLKVETKKGSKLGKVIDYTISSDDFIIQQLIVKRPVLKSLVDPELTIPRKEIFKVTDYKVIVKSEEKTLLTHAETEEFIPNFINPFRKTEQDYAPAQTKTPDDKDS